MRTYYLFFLITSIRLCESMFYHSTKFLDCYMYYANKITMFQSMTLQGNTIWKRVKWVMTPFFMF